MILMVLCKLRNYKKQIYINLVYVIQLGTENIYIRHENQNIKKKKKTKEKGYSVQIVILMKFTNKI